MGRYKLMTVIAVSIISVALMTGCGGGSNPTFAGETADLRDEDTALSAKEVESLQFMREEEKLARDTYLTLFGTWGINVFNNIASSEQTHTDAVKALMETYGVTDPALDAIGQFTNQELQALYDQLIVQGKSDAMSALWVGALIEETDIQDIVEDMADIENTEILATYASLLCGSRNHLRAFVSNIESRGGVYATQVQAIENVVNEILTTPQEQCN